MSLAIQNRQLILRSNDGSGSNNNKTYTVQWSRVLVSTFTQWIVHCKFVSLTGEFSGISAEIRWSLTSVNQTDSRGTGQTLSFPKIRQDINLDGTLEGSFLINDFDESLRLFVNTPIGTTLTISVYDMNGTLLSNMTDYVLSLIFEPVEDENFFYLYLF